MAQADAEDGQLADAGLHLLLHAGQRGGIAGAIAEEEALEAPVRQLRSGGIPGEHFEVQAHGRQLIEDAQLDAAIQHRHTEGAAGVQLVAVLAAHLGAEGLAGHVRQGLRLGHPRVEAAVQLRPDERRLGSLVTQVLGERPGVEIGHHGNVVALEPARQVTLAAGVVRRKGQAAAEQARGPGPGALVEVGVDAVDALLGEGHADHLPRETRIREDLLVARHGGGEHRLAAAPEAQRRPPPEDGSVLQDQVRAHVPPSLSNRGARLCLTARWGLRGTSRAAWAGGPPGPCQEPCKNPAKAKPSRGGEK